jgi:hypothetical protein
LLLDIGIMRHGMRVESVLLTLCIFCHIIFTHTNAVQFKLVRIWALGFGVRGLALIPPTLCLFKTHTHTNAHIFCCILSLIHTYTQYACVCVCVCVHIHIRVQYIRLEV